jgi:hypothetical protein
MLSLTGSQPRLPRFIQQLRIEPTDRQRQVPERISATVGVPLP